MKISKETCALYNQSVQGGRIIYSSIPNNEAANISAHFYFSVNFPLPENATKKAEENKWILNL